MIFASIFKWLSMLTEDLFVTAERPLFLVINQTKNEDFLNHVCRALTSLGADVVNLAEFYPKEFCHVNCFDGVAEINKKAGKIEITFTKNHKKIYKKTFLQNEIHPQKSYI